MRRAALHASWGKYWLTLVLLLLIGAVWSGRSWAQFTTARLSGSVVDASDSAIVGATVTVEQVGTGYTRSVKTSASGEYLFPSLPVGECQITVTMTSFKTYVQRGVTLGVGQAVTVPVHLQPGSLVQQVM